MKDYFKAAGFNLRERVNIYGGAVLGALAPVILFEKIAFSNEDYFLAWSSAFVASLIYIPVTGLIGLTCGALDAMTLRKQRIEKENLERKIENLKE